MDDAIEADEEVAQESSLQFHSCPFLCTRKRPLPKSFTMFHVKAMD